MAELIAYEEDDTETSESTSGVQVEQVVLSSTGKMENGERYLLIGTLVAYFDSGGTGRNHVSLINSGIAELKACETEMNDKANAKLSMPMFAVFQTPNSGSLSSYEEFSIAHGPVA